MLESLPYTRRQSAAWFQAIAAQARDSSKRLRPSLPQCQRLARAIRVRARRLLQRHWQRRSSGSAPPRSLQALRVARRSVEHFHGPHMHIAPLMQHSIHQPAPASPLLTGQLRIVVLVALVACRPSPCARPGRSSSFVSRAVAPSIGEARVIVRTSRGLHRSLGSVGSNRSLLHCWIAKPTPIMGPLQTPMGTLRATRDDPRGSSNFKPRSRAHAVR